MSDTLSPTPCEGSHNTINGPFNKMTIIEHSAGTTILENTLGTILLGIIALVLVFEVARLNDENRKLARGIK